VNGNVAVIIVQYRSGSIEQLIQDLSQQGVARIVVIDNGVDESYDRTSRIGGVVVHELAFGFNLGYGAAINRGLTMVEESMVVISNPDVVVHPARKSRRGARRGRALLASEPSRRRTDPDPSPRLGCGARQADTRHGGRSRACAARDGPRAPQSF